MDFKTIQLLYSMGMGFGFFILAETAYGLSAGFLGVESLSRNAAGRDFSQSFSVTPLIACWLSILACMLIGMRFFWAVTNVRRLAEDKARNAASTDATRKAIVTLHLPVLMLHVLFYYMMCHLLADISRDLPSGHGPLTMATVYAAYQLMNAAWLRWLVRGRTTCFREVWWMRNNVQFSSLGLAIVSLGYLNLVGKYECLGLCSLVFIIGSVRDLVCTSYHYLQDPERVEGQS